MNKSISKYIEKWIVLPDNAYLPASRRICSVKSVQLCTLIYPQLIKCTSNKSSKPTTALGLTLQNVYILQGLFLIFYVTKPKGEKTKKKKCRCTLKIHISPPIKVFAPLSRESKLSIIHWVEEWYHIILLTAWLAYSLPIPKTQSRCSQLGLTHRAEK